VPVKVFRARWIFPMHQPPIENGWVAADGHRIIALGSRESPPSNLPIDDLGDAAILPGLINAHTHTEFSDLTVPVGWPGIKLDQWIGLVVGARRMQTDPGAAITSGVAMAVAGGARLIGEIATLPWPGFEKALSGDLVVFGEVLGLDAARAQDRLAAAAAFFLQAEGAERIVAAVSPHAPYSTSLETIRNCVRLATERGSIVAMHVAESTEERELIEWGTGPFAQRLQEMGLFQSELFGRGSTATQEVLDALSAAPAALIIHGNDLQLGEIQWLSSQSHMTVVYCPRTHAYFEHAIHPVSHLLGAGVRVALGTDSLASNPDLSIWNEIRWLLEHRPDIPWYQTLLMGTVYGADAFRRPDLGRIESGANCGLIAVAGNARCTDDLVDQWIHGGPPRLLSQYDA